MNIEVEFNRCLEEKERECGRNIPLKEIAETSQIGLDVIQKLRASHYRDISSVSIGDILTIANYFKIPLYDFIKVNNTTDKIVSPSRCCTGEEFKKAISKSKYYSTYMSVPTLLDSIASFIDENRGVVLAGVVSNFNLKLATEDVLVRFFSKNEKIYIKDVLFGKAIALDNKKLYQKIYGIYWDTTQKNSIDTEENVKTLISLVQEYI